MYLRSLRSFSAFAATSIVLLGLAQVADAAGAKDKQALGLHDKAMDDYLATDFPKAEKKLREAVKTCGKDGCSPEVLGKLHIALGTVVGVAGKLDGATEEFVAALKADPKATLNKDLTTPELDKAFKDAQKQVGGGAGGSGTKPPTGEEPTGEEPGAKKPAGDLNHTPPPEQAVNTPVPVYVELPDDIEATKLQLRYKPFGGNKYKTLEMKKVGKGFGAEIPCEDVTTTGDIKYYITAQDESGSAVATAGTSKDPYKVTIKNDIEGEAPHLPGKKAPDQCRPKEDCPPGLPGCPDAKGGPRGDKGWGATCDNTQECQAGLICLNGTCEEGKEDDDASKGKGKRNLIAAWGQLDMLLISGTENVCSPANKDSYACFYEGTSDQFYGDAAKAGGTNGIQGGFGIAGARAMLSYDRQWIKNFGFVAGVRIGFAFGGSPSSETKPFNSAPKGTTQANSFLPVHAEVRAAYYFGGSPLEEKKLRPYVMIGGGVAQVNASVPVVVCDKLEKNGDPIDEDATEKGCPDGTRKVSLDAYQITGLNFAEIGGGVVYGITPFLGVAAEVKAMFMLPTFGIVFAPTIGPVFGF